MVRCADADVELERVLPPSGVHQGWPLHGSAATRTLERLAAVALAPHALMQRAGAATARLARAVAPHARCICVLAGPGNNGGDGLEAALQLHLAGHDVRVACVGHAGPLPVDAAAALERARQAGVAVASGLGAAHLDDADVIIDALLGMGVSRPPAGELAAAVAAANGTRALRLSIDLPSGLPADTGCLGTTPDASRCIQAHHTLSLLTLKPGLFTADGRDHAGCIWFCSIGVDASLHATDMALCGQADANRARPLRRHAQHKGSFGNVVVVGGAKGMVGAAFLAARSALRRGAGRVLVQLPDGGPVVDPACPELMLREAIDWNLTTGAEWAVACGCGGGDRLQEVLPTVLSHASRLVLDADALNAIAADPLLQALLARRTRRQPHTVLTPHPLEAARLLGCSTAQVQADRIARARELATRYGATVLLKGSGSITATPDGQARINPSGSAALATAGTGDVLAGWIAALLARGADAAMACTAAAFEHGTAADAWAAAHPLQPLTASAL